MNWNIEYNNGILLSEENNKFEIKDKHLVKRIFFSDKKNRYGFYLNGVFFINNIDFDLKIKIDNFNLIPIQYKTCETIFNCKIDSKIISWNIGYKLINDKKHFEYIMSINNSNVFLLARKYDENKNVIDKKAIKLQ